MEGEAEFAWACGLFEGEGYVMHASNGRGSKRRGLGLAMTDEDVVRKFHRVVGVGVVRGPRLHRHPKWKPIWTWEVGRWTQVRPLLTRMLPLMGERRAEKMSALLADPPTQRAYRTHCRIHNTELVSYDGDTGRRCPECRGRRVKGVE